MNLVYISYIITVSASSVRNAWFSCEGRELNKDQIIIIELARDGRAYTDIANLSPVDDHWHSYQELMVGKLCDCHG